jgi:NADH-quinone oxidoreductase subunit E
MALANDIDGRHHSSQRIARHRLKASALPGAAGKDMVSATPSCQNAYAESKRKLMPDIALNSDDRTKLIQAQQEIVHFPAQRSSLIPLLQLMQAKLSFLPDAAIRIVARYLDLSRAEVYSVATFYNQFRFHPPGRHPIAVCLGTACHVKGADIILENFERKLEIKAGETTVDRQFSIDRVACVGCCALAPVAVMDTTLHGHMMPSKVEGLVLRARIETEKSERERYEDESRCK